MEKSINVKYISLNNINNVYKVLPVGDYKIMGQITNSLYRDESFYRFDSNSPISRGVTLLINNEPGLILNHESSFFSFKPEDVKIFTAICKNQCLPICNENPYFPSLKDWTENQYGKVKHVFVLLNMCVIQIFI